MTKVLVLDLGTTYFKASIFSEDGELCVLRQCPTPSTSPLEGRHEIDPDLFRSTITTLIHSLADEQKSILAEVTAVTFSTQTNSFLLLGEHDAPLSPIIVWNDQRAQGTTNFSSLDDFHATTGIPALGHEFMVAKLLWLREHEPETLAHTKRLCLLSDYLTLWLTGQHISEAGTMGLTGLINIHTLDYCPKVLEQFQVNPKWLPTIARAGTDLGQIALKVAEALALTANCRFIVGCLDQYAGAIGAGNVSPGSVSETTGTVLATVRCVQEANAHNDPAVFLGPGFDEGQYFQMLFGDTSGNLLECYRDLLPEHHTFTDLDHAAALIPAGASGLQLPWREDAHSLRNSLLDWSTRYRYDQAVRAILEGVAFALHDQLTRLCGEESPDTITCVGGAARSELWLQIKADILNVTTTSIHCPEPTSLGAAMLALRTLCDTDLLRLTERCSTPHSTATPNAVNHQLYQNQMNT